jgi:uncharacterized damage-inducible protein DinB
MPFRQALLAEFDHEMAATRRLLSCIPDQTLGWKPHEKSRSVAELAAHVTEITRWSVPILDLNRFDLDAAPTKTGVPGTTAMLLQQFREHVNDARSRLQREDVELTAMWSLMQGAEELFSLPRAAAFRIFVLGHIVHHRGQLSVYLRMNDVPLPPIYGPTADFAGRSERNVPA